MATAERITAGDFTHLAQQYAKYRPGYSETVLRAILGVINPQQRDIHCVDVGAGTGIWTRLLAKQLNQSIIAIEPNDAMRAEGQVENGVLDIIWRKGAAEQTGLPNQSVDLVSMASSFHWADFDRATQEFHRILKPDGYFLILWNPRHLENNPLLLDIEQYIFKLNPAINRISSGKSKHIDEITKKLSLSPLFDDMWGCGSQ
jgi:ubiquinone/menaquinone biosynthesis C-methylase UbiE